AGVDPVDTSPAPAPTEAPAPDVTTPAPAPTQAPTPDVTTPAPVDGEGDGTDWLPIVLIVIGGAIVLGLIAAAMSKRGGSDTHAGERSSRQTTLLSTSQWIHDQLTLELQAAPPQAALTRWTTERRRLDDLAIGAQQQGIEGNGPGWTQLGQSVSALAAAVDTNLQLRVQEPVNQQLVSQSNEVVNRHRAAMQQITASLWQNLRR
ncbi:MAG: hypothetical protein WBP59_13300, partial [Ilumatobacteraceae bacterium]